MVPIRITYVGGTDEDHRAFSAALEAAGSSVRYSLPAEAVALLSAGEIDLVVIDLMQPSHDVLAMMRAAASGSDPAHHIPVIVAAPREALDRVTACLQRGADEYLTTPYDPAHPLTIVRRVETCVERYHLRRPHAAQHVPEPTQALHVGEAVEQMQTVHRFIPREFLDLLQRQSLSDVHLGDHVEREMTVFFSDIRDFTHLSESLTPAQNFNFLTSYLRNVTPIIRKCGGFVDKYLGDGVMALFPGDAIDAVRAAVELLQQLERYNLGRRLAGYVPIRVGMGLHRGKLMLGTIGTEDQMQTTVIADAVNLAARIEGMTKTFGVSILLSGSVVAGLPEVHPFHLRGLGAVTAKGKSESAEIFECYDHDAEELSEHKTRTLPQFTAAMQEFRKGQLLTAGRIFGRIAEMNGDDAVAAYFRDRCTLNVIRERRGAWDGAEHLEVK